MNCASFPTSVVSRLAHLWKFHFASIRSNNSLFQNIDRKVLDAPLDGVVWRKTIAKLLDTASLHIILVIFTEAGLIKLSPAV